MERQSGESLIPIPGPGQASSEHSFVIEADEPFEHLGRHLRSRSGFTREYLQRQFPLGEADMESLRRRPASRQEYGQEKEDDPWSYRL